MREKNVKVTLAGIFAAALLSLFVMAYYVISSRHTGKINIADIPVLTEEDGAYLEIEEISEDDSGTLYVTAAAENPNIQYDYVNQVLGPGRGEYKKVTLLVIDKENAEQAYRLKTYPRAFSSEKIQQTRCENNGYLAYGKEKMGKPADIQIAALFEDKEGNFSIKYAKKDGAVHE